jgi:hypothetical protein
MPLFGLLTALNGLDVVFGDSMPNTPFNRRSGHEPSSQFWDGQSDRWALDVCSLRQGRFLWSTALYSPIASTARPSGISMLPSGSRVGASGPGVTGLENRARLADRPNMFRRAMTHAREGSSRRASINNWHI